ncbi:MAG: tRNA (guanosine(46)-N7)-methyltransferase TrmB [Alphaproteobacteria bacterium GM202ARS2]|nr:tRNA (guanosine(46)-N7)-methyltransferase TrmB [Alphaproteobacteria bacterium GM202ARS2]
MGENRFGGCVAQRGQLSTFRARRWGRGFPKSAQAAYGHLLQRWGIHLDRESGQSLEPQAFFDEGLAGYAVEIGCGGGEHVVAQALLFPERGFIACEIHTRGVLRLLRSIEACRLHNVRVYAGDGLGLVSRFVPASIDGLFTLFPDPWPKRRHYGRRLFQPDTVGVLAGALRAGACWRFATDCSSYAAWAHACLRDSSMRLVSEGMGVPPRVDWPVTRYQCKAQRAGREVVFSIWQR